MLDAAQPPPLLFDFLAPDFIDSIPANHVIYFVPDSSVPLLQNWIGEPSCSNLVWLPLSSASITSTHDTGAAGKIRTVTITDGRRITALIKLTLASRA